MTRWTQLEQLYAYSSNFKNYRAALAAAKPPAVPFLGT
jgi:hypothetical protein